MSALPALKAIQSQPDAQIEPPVAAAQPATGTRVLDIEKADGALPLPLMLKAAAERHGKSLQHLVMDIARTAFGPGKLGVEDYFALRLFDDVGMSAADKRAFAGPKAFRQIAAEMNYNEHWLVTTGHKLVTEALLSGFGFPVARTRALYSTIAAYPAFRMLNSPGGLSEYLTDPSIYPVFAKPIDGSLSLGTAGLTGFDPATGRLMQMNGQAVAVDDFIADVTRHYADGYLFQEPLVPHADIQTLIGDRLPTVRLYTLNGPDGPELFRAVWKIPAGDSMADNYWRGNLLAALDYETGAITRVIRGNALDQVTLEAHPDTGKSLIGARVPHWPATVQLVLDAARTLSEVVVVGWDVAPTVRGPVIVEANDRPDFRLAQMAERRGILDERLLSLHAWAKGVRRAIQKDTADVARAAKRRAREKAFKAVAEA